VCESFNCTDIKCTDIKKQVAKAPNAVKYFYGVKLLLEDLDRLVIGIGKYARNNVLAMGAHSVKIDLGFGDPSRSPEPLAVGQRTRDPVRQRLNPRRER
jgi:hypothetical protein